MTRAEYWALAVGLALVVAAILITELGANPLGNCLERTENGVGCRGFRIP